LRFSWPPPAGLVSAEDLLEKAWDINADPFTNAVRITISTLRAKLGQPPVIETVAGVGYRLMTSASPKARHWEARRSSVNSGKMPGDASSPSARGRESACQG
jgi:DNA-binding winged helix-turn-helix (wHTH) protein